MNSIWRGDVKVAILVLREITKQEVVEFADAYQGREIVKYPGLVETLDLVPKYQTDLAAGCDLYAAIDAPIKLQPMERRLIPTGIVIELPPGYEAQLRPRSGLAVKQGLTVLNSPGTIDADYRGEIQALIINLGSSFVTLLPGDRIAQLVIAKHERAQFVVVEELSPTGRGTGGCGSTGTR